MGRWDWSGHAAFGTTGWCRVASPHTAGRNGEAGPWCLPGLRGQPPSTGLRQPGTTVLSSTGSGQKGVAGASFGLRTGGIQAQGQLLSPEETAALLTLFLPVPGQRCHLAEDQGRRGQGFVSSHLAPGLLEVALV